LIHGWGLEAYYDLRPESAGEGPVEVAGSDNADLDDSTLLGRSAPVPVETEAGELRWRCRVAVAGLHCAACVWLLEQAPRRVDGWEASTVNYRNRTLELVFDPQRIRLSRIGGILNRLGYRIGPLDADGGAGEDTEQQQMLIHIAVAGFCAANAMWVAVALYAGEYSGMAAEHRLVLRVAGVLLGAIAVVVPGRVFFRGAIASLSTRTPHMDLPVAVGLAAGLIASCYGLLDRSLEVYFDSIAMLVFFLLVGRWVQSRQQRRAGEQVAGLLQLAPRAATRIQPDGTEQRVGVESLAVGDLVRVGISESLPVDGEVVTGRSLIDRSLLTGESKPVAVAAGDFVEAGTDNLQSVVVVRAHAVGGDTRFAAITDAVATAASARTPMVQLANRIGGWFVGVVLSLAIATALIWWWLDPNRIIPNSVSLLIVACPCALALATPLAIAVVIGRLANRKVLIRAGDCLERLSRPGTVFFDKTGTLTAGRVSVTDFVGDRDALVAIQALESNVSHPIAAALVTFAREPREGAKSATFRKLSSTSDSSVAVAANVDQIPGRGVRGWVGDTLWQIGNETMIGEAVGTEAMDAWRQPAWKIRQSGSSPVWVAREREVVAVLGVSDPIRQDAGETLTAVLRLGWKVGILSGDDVSTVDRVGRQLGIEASAARGGLLPDQKRRAVAEAAASGPVVMVGDGLNDAAALAAADVGVALRGGASASLTAAPVMIADGRLSRVVDLLIAAGALRRSIRRNFAVSIAYNGIAVVLAMAGWISPLLAAVLMPVSSVSVIAMTLASRTFPASQPDDASERTERPVMLSRDDDDGDPASIISRQWKPLQTEAGTA